MEDLCTIKLWWVFTPSKVIDNIKEFIKLRDKWYFLWWPWNKKYYYEFIKKNLGYIITWGAVYWPV